MSQALILCLHRAVIILQSEAGRVNRYWRWLFAEWLDSAEDEAITAQLHLSLVNALPPLPGTGPFFVDTDYLPDSVGLLSVYRWEPKGVLLHYFDGAVIQVPMMVERPFLNGFVLLKALDYGRLEDITFTSLAPYLRRQGYYLIHAFGVAKDGRGWLLVGASGSGKTTTGLSLVLAGWELLANDILLLEVRHDGIYALPTPGGLSVREETLGLLPACQRFVADVPCVNGRYNLTNQQVWQGQIPQAVRLSAIYFCQVGAEERSTVRPLRPSVTLAQLMEQSVDRWDEAMLEEHVTFLQHLTQQAESFDLFLGRDVSQLPHLLANSS